MARLIMYYLPRSLIYRSVSQTKLIKPICLQDVKVNSLLNSEVQVEKVPKCTHSATSSFATERSSVCVFVCVYVAQTQFQSLVALLWRGSVVTIQTENCSLTVKTLSSYMTGKLLNTDISFFSFCLLAVVYEHCM